MKVDDLAVATMPIAEVQAADFLMLNEDKPGTPATVERYFVPGKYNIVGYFSAYDDTCVELEKALLQLTQTRKDIAVRIVDINRPGVESIDWQSPVAEEMRLQTLPHFQIFDPSGKLRAQGRPALEQVRAWVQ